MIDDASVRIDKVQSDYHRSAADGKQWPHGNRDAWNVAVLNH